MGLFLWVKLGVSYNSKDVFLATSMWVIAETAGGQFTTLFKHWEAVVKDVGEGSVEVVVGGVDGEERHWEFW